MKIILDECVDRRFATEISGHDVKTVPQMGWATIKNGELLSLAENEFDIFVTVDETSPSSRTFPNSTSPLLCCVRLQIVWQT